MSAARESPLGAIEASYMGQSQWSLAVGAAAALHVAAAIVLPMLPKPAPEPVVEEQMLAVDLGPPGGRIDTRPRDEAPPPPPKEAPPAVAPTGPTERAPDAEDVTLSPPPPPSDTSGRLSSGFGQGGAPAPPAPPPPPPPEPPLMDQNQLRAYLAAARQEYFQVIEYPLRARQEGLEGTGMLRVTVRRNGRVLAATLRQSTGHLVLDAELERAANLVTRLPALPRGFARDEFVFNLPLRFQVVYDDRELRRLEREDQARAEEAPPPAQGAPAAAAAPSE